MKKLLLCFSFSLAATFTNATEISVYDQAVLNGSGVPIANFTGQGEIISNDAGISRRGFLACRETKSCTKQDIIDYIEYINGDANIQPIDSQPIKVPEPNTAVFVAAILLGLGFRKLLKTNTKHKC